MALTTMQAGERAETAVELASLVLFKFKEPYSETRRDLRFKEVALLSKI